MGGQAPHPRRTKALRAATRAARLSARRCRLVPEGPAVRDTGLKGPARAMRGSRLGVGARGLSFGAWLGPSGWGCELGVLGAGWARGSSFGLRALFVRIGWFFFPTHPPYPGS